MQVLTTQIQLEAECFFPQLVAVAKGRASDYALRWKEKKESAAVRHEEFAGRVESGRIGRLFRLFCRHCRKDLALQLANSTPVRYGQLFDYFQVKRVDGNRGTSGIDGSTSTAVGAALMREGITTLITGDMSFLYDSNALWNKYISSRLKIIVMKNAGVVCSDSYPSFGTGRVGRMFRNRDGGRCLRICTTSSFPLFQSKR